MKKAIAAILTDTHLKESNIEINKSIYLQAIKITKKFGLDKIIHAGDVFDSRKAQPQSVLIAFLEILNLIEDHRLTLTAIKGNHDTTNYASSDSFLEPFVNHPAFYLISTHDIDKINDKISFSYLSHFSEEVYIDSLKKVSKNIDSNVKNVLITHVDICGGRMNNGIEIQNRVTVDLFKSFDKVLVGHWHDHQIMDKGRIEYIGSSLQHNFGETDNKGLTIVYDDLSTEMYPLDFPKYTTFIVDTDVTKYVDMKKEDLEGNTRIILRGSPENVKAFDRSKLTSVGVKVMMDSTNIERFDNTGTEINFDSNGIIEEFKNFCELKKIDYNEGISFLKLLS